MIAAELPKGGPWTASSRPSRGARPTVQVDVAGSGNSPSRRPATPRLLATPRLRRGPRPPSPSPLPALRVRTRARGSGRLGRVRRPRVLRSDPRGARPHASTSRNAHPAKAKAAKNAVVTSAAATFRPAQFQLPSWRTRRRGGGTDKPRAVAARRKGFHAHVGHHPATTSSSTPAAASSAASLTSPRRNPRSV
jgi:hypothetical protein